MESEGGEGGRKEDGEAGEVESVGVGDILVTGDSACPSPYVFAPLRHCVKQFFTYHASTCRPSGALRHLVVPFSINMSPRWG